jgi:DNA-binding CsgD family transcriptional regulator
MPNTIFTLFADKKFDKIRYYLEERGIINLADLATFNFEELMFVPGVSDYMISDAKDRFFAVTGKTSANAIIKNKTSSVCNESDTSVAETEDTLPVESMVNIPASNRPVIYDALITDVFYKVPRSAPFVRKCIAEGKELMSHLSDADFDEAVKLKGIGVASAENLRRIFVEFNEVSSNCNSVNRVEHENMALISSLPFSVRAINCLKKAGISSIEELMLLTMDDLMNIKNLGEKTCREILSLCERIPSVELNSTKLYYLKNIAPDNKYIPISLLHNISVSKQGIDLLKKNGYLTVKDLCEHGLNLREYSYVRNVANYLSTSVAEHFMKRVEALKGKEKMSMLERCNGATLQEIGQKIGVTRERVRQILKRICRKLKKSAELVAGALLSVDKNAFSYFALQQMFSAEQTAMCCKFVLQESSYVRYFKFSDKFIRTNNYSENIDQKLKEYTDEIIGEGINFYDSLELIEAELQKRRLDYFDFEDIMNYIVQNGYHFYGDYVIKGKQSYANVCYDAVRKFFAFDIKLDSDVANEDMYRLRQIISKHYQGLPIPPSNRALTAAMTRDATKMVLSGRGRYCPIEKVIYNVLLLDEVRDFIQDSTQTSFYYSELYSKFQGRFLAETNINNHHFLHGLLKCLYPNEFTYERDMLVKSGALRQDVNDRLSQLLLEQGRAMTKSEIKKEIPGINDFVITFSVMRLPEVIQWEYNEFNHIENIHFTSEDLNSLRRIIKSLTDTYGGYASDALLYNMAKVTCKKFLTRNHMRNAQNLYYVTAYLLGEEYRFRRPHITIKDFPVEELTVTNIARTMLQCENTLNYEQYCHLAEKLGWAGGTQYAVFSDLEKDYIRISENDYIKKELFDVSQDFIKSLNIIIHSLVDKSGYYAFSSIFDYEEFPEYKYKWNGFLLESLISEYDTGFRIVTPQIRDRRYQRGIIVPNESSYNTFNDLVIGMLTNNGVSSISERGLQSFLKMRGIITTVLPQEIYDCQYLKYKNEIFTLLTKH